MGFFEYLCGNPIQVGKPLIYYGVTFQIISKQRVNANDFKYIKTNTTYTFNTKNASHEKGESYILTAKSEHREKCFNVVKFKKEWYLIEIRVLQSMTYSDNTIFVAVFIGEDYDKLFKDSRGRIRNKNIEYK